MSIIIQEMFDKLSIAVVVYSEDYNGDTHIVFNKVYNKTADKLLSGEEKGDVFKIAKYLTIGFEKKQEQLSLQNLEQCRSYQYSKNDLGKLKEQTGDEKTYNHIMKTFELAAIVSDLYRKKGHAIDVEFVIPTLKDENVPVYILQQRPYISDSNYRVRALDNGFVVGSKKGESKIINGEVVSLNYDKKGYCLSNDISNIDDKIIIANFAGVKYSFLGYIDENNVLDRSKLIIDNGAILRAYLYTHGFNKLREKGANFMMTSNANAFSEVKTGDRLEINLETGEYKHYPKEMSDFRKQQKNR